LNTPSPDLSGKHILVTGGSAGIGRETALGLARLGTTVTLVGRDPARTAETVDFIRQESGNANIDSLLADFSTLAGVRDLATAFKARHDRLDILVNNAGAWFGVYGETADGFEQHWAVNHLSYVLLTHELLDPLRAAPNARIVNVASDLHARGRIDDRFDASHYNSIKAYSRSKLANVLFTYALARRLKDTTITANCLHPGAVKTNIAKDMRGLLKLVNRALGALFFVTPEEGARTSIHLAAAPELEKVSGRYFSKCREIDSCRSSHDEALQESVWKLSAEQCGIAWP